MSVPPISPSLQNLIANPIQAHPAQTNMMVQATPQGVQEQTVDEPKKNRKMGVGIAAAVGAAALVAAGILLFKGRADKALDITSDVHKVEDEMKGAFQKIQAAIGEAVKKDNVLVEHSAEGTKFMVGIETLADGSRTLQKEFILKPGGLPYQYSESIKVAPNGDNIVDKFIKWDEKGAASYFAKNLSSVNGEQKVGAAFKFDGENWIKDIVDAASSS